MIDEEKLKMIKKLNTPGKGNKKVNSFLTDDRVLVLIKNTFDPETGDQLPSSVIGTISESEIADRILELDSEKSELQKLLSSKWAV